MGHPRGLRMPVVRRVPFPSASGPQQSRDFSFLEISNISYNRKVQQCTSLSENQAKEAPWQDQLYLNDL